MIYQVLGIRRSGIHCVADYISALVGKPVANNLSHALIYDNKCDNKICIFEEISPVKVDAHKIDDTSSATVNIVVVRDPLNLAASRIKHYGLISTEGLFISTVALSNWSEYYFCLQTKKQLTKTKTIYVNYNLFVSDGEYRTKLLSDLGGDIAKAEKTLHKINPNGGGSTWDNCSAKKMKVNDRYKYYWDLPIFKALIPADKLAEIQEAFNVSY